MKLSRKRRWHKSRNDRLARTLNQPLEFNFGDDPRLPAVTMTQYAAKQYTKWLSLTTGQQYRLPTEAEWEYAARAGSQTAYCFGDSAKELDEYACYWENSNSGPSQVGKKKPNAFGLHDMHGNVWEWTIEGYTFYGHRSRSDTILGIGHTVELPNRPDNRCVRGGGWQHSFDRCRSAARMGSDDKAWKDSDPDIKNDVNVRIDEGRGAIGLIEP